MIKAKDCLLFLTGNGDGYGYGYGDGNGNGYGDGYGYGNGYGNGDGDGYGDGYGYGNGYGNGDGDGNGDGYGYGNGYGNGDGYGNGNGYGNGDGYGNGYGDGYGNGYGDGYGNGDGYGDGDFSMPHPYYKIDGMWCEILQIKGNYAKINLIDIYNSENCRAGFVARDGEGNFAHGATLKEAREDLIYKIGNRDDSKFAKWKLTDVKPSAEIIKAYRIITGACREGTKYFCKSIEIPKTCTIAEAIKMTRGQYGWERFNSFFNKKGE